ncbi:MAG: hypothetical protein ACFB50_09710 [Rubrobacteraceae bacterium]
MRSQMRRLNKLPPPPDLDRARAAVYLARVEDPGPDPDLPDPYTMSTDELMDTWRGVEALIDAGFGSAENLERMTAAVKNTRGHGVYAEYDRLGKKGK